MRKERREWDKERGGQEGEEGTRERGRERGGEGRGEIEKDRLPQNSTSVSRSVATGANNLPLTWLRTNELTRKRKETRKKERTKRSERTK